MGNPRKSRRRAGGVRSYIEFIGCEEFACAVFFLALIAEGIDLRNYVSTIIGGEGLKGIKPLAVAGQSHGHNGNAGEGVTEFCELTHTPIKLRTVIDAAAKHNLRTDIKPGIREAAQV